MDTKRKSKITSMIISIVLIIVLSVVFFNIRKNYLYTNRDRLIIFCYETNISGSDGEKWAEHLKNQFPEISDFEAKKTCAMFFAAGFSLMMLLDVALG